MLPCQSHLFGVVVAIVQLSLTVTCCTAQQTWFDSLPAEVRDNILWKADYESEDLTDWLRASEDVSGSGIFNTGGDDVSVAASRQVAHSGGWAVETRITNASRAERGKRAVRLMIWTDRPWNQKGDYFPREAWYSTWMYFPHRYAPEKHPPWDPGDGGWWNVFQFKSIDASGANQPVWTLNVASEADRGMFFYLYSDVNEPHSYEQSQPRYFQEKEWVHVEAYLRSDTDGRGRITIFQDGHQILDADSVTTSLGGTTGDDTHPIWGIGNYTDHIAGDPRGEGRATIYFDDTAVSRVPLSPFAAE